MVSFLDFHYVGRVYLLYFNINISDFILIVNSRKVVYKTSYKEKGFTRACYLIFTFLKTLKNMDFRLFRTFFFNTPRSNFNGHSQN